MTNEEKMYLQLGGYHSADIYVPPGSFIDFIFQIKVETCLISPKKL